MNVLKDIYIPEPENRKQGCIAVFYDSYPYLLNFSEIKPDSVRNSHVELLSKRENGTWRLNSQSVLFFYESGKKFMLHLNPQRLDEQIDLISDLAEYLNKNGLIVREHFAKLKASKAKA